MNRLPLLFGFLTLGVPPLAPLHALPLTSSTHPTGVFYDFSDNKSVPPIQPYQAPAGVQAAVTVKVDNGFLRMINRAGGSFGVKVNVAPFDADKLSHLVFDYKLSPDVKVDLFFKYNGVYHGVHFSGPGELRPGSVALGAIANVKADNQWHQAVVPVRAWLRRLYPAADSLTVDEVLMGNWNNQGYLLAGIGGNGPGATWSLDNLALVTPGPRSAKINLAGAPLYTVDEGVRQKNTQSSEVGLTLAPGPHRIDALNASGAIQNSFPLLVAEEPRAGKPSWHGNDLVWPLSDGAGLTTKGLKLEVDGQAYPVDGVNTVYDGVAGELILHAGQLGLGWKDNSLLAVSLLGATDRIGQGPGQVNASVNVDFSHHDDPLPNPFVKFDNLATLGDGTFEAGLDEWAPGDPPGAIVERDDSTKAAGKYSLRLTCPRSATPFMAVIRKTAFDAAKYPVITFDYKATDRLRVDFKIVWAGIPAVIHFTDRDDNITRLGDIDSVATDGQWHHATIPLLEWMKKLRPAATNFTVDRLTVGDQNWLGNARGVQWWVDNWQFAPVVSGGTLRGQVTLPDVTGVKGASWVLDDNPTTEPDTKAESDGRFQVKGDGRLWLHLRAQNGAGVWSSAIHIPVIFPVTDTAAGTP